MIDAMVRKGYLNEGANSVLVTVEGKESARVEKQVVEHIGKALDKNTLEGSVISIELEKKNQEVAEFAQKNNITQGKAELIDKIAKKNPVLIPDELAGLSINELGVLISSSKVDGSSVKQSGTASTKDYIGKEAALAKALEHASLTQDQVSDVEIELNLKGGSMVYEVEFEFEKMEYEHVINAVDGTVIKCKQELEDDEDEDKNEVTAPAISAAEARDIALEAAKVAADGIRGLEVELERRNGGIYEIKFVTADGFKYTYYINAQTKEIVSSTVKELANKENTEHKVPQAQVNVQQVKDIVLAHAMVDADAVKGYRSKLDTDDGVTVYEIEFIANGFEYEYEVDAATGDILDAEKEELDEDDDDFAQLKPIGPEGEAPVPPQKPEGEAPVPPQKPEGDATAPEHPEEAPMPPQKPEGDVTAPEHPQGDTTLPGYSDSQIQNRPAPEEGQPQRSSDVSPKDALDKALEHAGVDMSLVTDIEIETDRKDGSHVHKVEFDHEGREHEYHVDAATGQIIHNETDD